MTVLDNTINVIKVRLDHIPQVLAEVKLQEINKGPSNLDALSETPDTPRASFKDYLRSIKPQLPIRPPLDLEARARVREFDRTVAKRLGKGASDFANKQEYRKALRNFVDLMYFTDNPDRLFLLATFHL